MGLFWQSLALLLAAKTISMSSPFILKRIVNSMTAAYTSANIVGGAGTLALAAAVPQSTLKRAAMSIGLWGLTKIVSSILLCF